MIYTKERNKKISEKLKNRPFSEEHKRKLKLAWEKRRLIPVSKETRIKISKGVLLSHKNDPKLGKKKANKGKKNGMYGKGYKLKGNKNGMYNNKHTKETKEKIRQKAIGRKPTDEARKNMSISHKKRYEDIEERMKSSQPKELNGNWNNGSSYEPYSTDWTETLKRSIRERDNYTCQMLKCNTIDKSNPVHHIDYDKKNCNPNNLITLCKKCHSKTNGKRDYWTKYFQKIIYKVIN